MYVETLNMTTLTIYTHNYDSNENIINDGMSDCAYIDMDNKFGIPFTSLDSALEYCVENEIEPDMIEMNYLSPKNGIQMFKKFKISKKW